MKRIILWLWLTSMPLSFSGCYWFIDARAKRAMSITAAEVGAACKQMTPEAASTPEGKSLLRVKPVVDNLNAYVWGKAPMAEAAK